MPRPSQIIFTVNIFGFWLFPYNMLFREDGDSPHIVANLFIEMFLSPQSCNMRFLSTVTVSIDYLLVVTTKRIPQRIANYRRCMILLVYTSPIQGEKQ